MAQKRFFNVATEGKNVLREAHTAKDVLEAYGVILAEGERAKAFPKQYTTRTGGVISYVPISKAVYDEYFTQQLETAQQPAAETVADVPDIAAQVEAEADAVQTFASLALIATANNKEAREEIQQAAIDAGASLDSYTYETPSPESLADASLLEKAKAALSMVTDNAAYEDAETVLSQVYNTLASDPVVNVDHLKAAEKALEAVRFSDADEMELRLGFLLEYLTGESKQETTAQTAERALELLDVASDETDFGNVERLLADVRDKVADNAEQHSLAIGALDAVKAGGSRVAAHFAAERLLGALLVSNDAPAQPLFDAAQKVASGGRTKRRRQAARERAQHLTALAQRSALLTLAFLVGQCLAIVAL